MLKGWKCKNCKSFRIKNLEILRDYKQMVQGECEDCGVTMRFTKYGSHIYKIPAKKLERIPF